MTEKNTKLWFIEPKNEEEFNEIIAHDMDENDTLTWADSGWLVFLNPVKNCPQRFDCTNSRNYIPAGYFEITIEQFREMYGKKEDVVEQREADTNPKASIGSQALPMSMCSPLFAAHVALGKYNGMLKYGGSNYIGTEVVMSIYLDAIQRHLDKIKMGEVVDEVDGVNHFGAIGANCDIILSAQAAGTLIDDRLRSDGQLEAYKALTPLVKSLQELHKNKNPKHYYAKEDK